MVDRVSHYFPHCCPVGPPSCCCCALHGGFHSVKIAGGCTHQNGPQFLTGRQRNKKLVPELMSPDSEPDKPPLTLLPAELDSLPVWSLSSHPIPSPCGCSLQSKEICHFTGQIPADCHCCSHSMGNHLSPYYLLTNTFKDSIWSSFVCFFNHSQSLLSKIRFQQQVKPHSIWIVTVTESSSVCSCLSSQQ